MLKKQPLPPTYYRRIKQFGVFPFLLANFTKCTQAYGCQLQVFEAMLFFVSDDVQRCHETPSSVIENDILNVYPLM